MEKITDYCPFCNFKSLIIHGPYNDYVDIDCPHCGNYRSTEWAIQSSDFYNNRDKYPILSYWIRKNQNKKDRIILDRDLINNILENHSLPSLIEQTENLIRLIGDKVKKPDEFYIEEFHVIASRIGSYDASSVRYISKHLEEENVVRFVIDSDPRFQGYLLFKGWEEYEKIKKGSSESLIAFMAMQYNDKTLEKIYSDYLKNSVKQTGFELRRLDEQLKAGLIDDQLRVEIRKARFLIADLTHENRGAYWEAGYAEGLGKPVIYLCKRDVFDSKKTHFDTNHLATITWELDTIGDDMNKLKATIRATFPEESKNEL